MAGNPNSNPKKKRQFSIFARGLFPVYVYGQDACAWTYDDVNKVYKLAMGDGVGSYDDSDKVSAPLVLYYLLSQAESPKKMIGDGYIKMYNEVTEEGSSTICCSNY